MKKRYIKPQTKVFFTTVALLLSISAPSHSVTAETLQLINKQTAQNTSLQDVTMNQSFTAATQSDALKLATNFGAIDLSGETVANSNAVNSAISNAVGTATEAQSNVAASTTTTTTPSYSY